MKESVLDVLIYLFESYMDEDQAAEPDCEALQAMLVEAGFQHSEIEKAFDWLEGLAGDRQVGPTGPTGARTTRLYHDSEAHKLDTECRGFLMFLEQTGVLTAESRELVIDRVMALDTDPIDLEQLKWIILMVLFNLPGEEAAYQRLEGLMMQSEVSSYLH